MSLDCVEMALSDKQSERSNIQLNFYQKPTNLHFIIHWQFTVVLFFSLLFRDIVVVACEQQQNHYLT